METSAAPAARCAPERDFGGTWIVLGDQQYKVPALNFKALRELTDRIADLNNVRGGLPTGEQMDTIVQVVHRALVRNYPGITEDVVSEILDTENMMHVFEAVLSTSGFVKREVPLGEQQAAS